MTCNLSICGKEPFRLSRDSKLCLTGWVLVPIELLGHMSVAGHILEWELTSCGVIWILFGKARIYVTFWDNNKLLLKIKILCVFYTILFYTTSETSARIHQVSKREKTFQPMKPQAEWFYCYRTFRNLMKSETWGFKITSPTKKISRNYHFNKFSEFKYFVWDVICEPAT